MSRRGGIVLLYAQSNDDPSDLLTISKVLLGNRTLALLGSSRGMFLRYRYSAYLTSTGSLSAEVSAVGNSLGGSPGYHGMSLSNGFAMGGIIQNEE